ncbi:hypothetical protein [Ancylobacter mangrovi]|uniref:hypothetical protein n=1 Tax=Ancylobacter mangrovi TaxID=2972472 RepID=UPI002163A960|nr:hypothetical protein [Ancylobacter mangrovi]MCS0503907.1 hypothetical protein [Ancylobacter mangrovi]
MMLRLLSRLRGADRREPAVWPWPSRIPAMIFAYGGAIIAVLMIERLMHSLMSANYAAIAVVPGGLAAGICAFALSFTPRSRLFVLVAVLVVSLLPLAVVFLSIDFKEYEALFEHRAIILAPIFAAAIVIVTGVLIVGGVFPSRRGSPPA